MALLGSLLKPGVSLLHCMRQFSTGVCVCFCPCEYSRGIYSTLSLSLMALGDFKAHPKDLIIGPAWVRGFRGNELQRLTRKKRMVGDRMMTEDRHNLEKRISYLYRRFNRYGKHR
uniref:Large ribosomal subunit protein mL51 n=1 Tax=Astyanax mexicanus TaxID=7994 RepID=A0A3B1JG38_ASTMX